MQEAHKIYDSTFLTYINLLLNNLDKTSCILNNKTYSGNIKKNYKKKSKTTKQKELSKKCANLNPTHVNISIISFFGCSCLKEIFNDKLCQTVRYLKIYL